MERPRNVIVPAVAALALALCAGVSGCTQQPQSADQQQHAQQPPSTEEQQHAQRPQSAEDQQHAQQPPSAEEQQHAQQPQSAEEQQHAQQAPSADQQHAQQPQNQNNRQKASNGQNEIALVNLNRDQIEQVQRALDRKGFKVGGVDGIMGPKTESALRSFQQQQKLQASGQIDQQTLAALGLNDLTQSTTGQGRGQQLPASGQQGRKQ